MYRYLFAITICLTVTPVKADECTIVFNTVPLSVQEQIENIQSHIPAKLLSQDVYVMREILLTFKRTIAEIRLGSGSYIKNKHMRPIHRYLDMRLGLLSQEERRRVESLPLSWTDAPVLGEARNVARFLDDVFLFGMPEHYRNTLIHHLIFSHELEHAIQETRLRQYVESDHWRANGPIAMEVLIEGLYLSEVGAMVAEWTFLQGVSGNEIEYTIRQIKNATDINDFFKTMLTRNFSNARLSLDEYIEREQRASRYYYGAFDNIRD